MISTAEDIMDGVFELGFKAAIVLTSCLDAGGEVTFGDISSPAKMRALWVTVKFPDGSYVNIYPHGCAGFWWDEKPMSRIWPGHRMVNLAGCN